MSGSSTAILVIGIVLLAVFAAFGLILWRIGRLKRAVAVARAWPTVPGRVVVGRIEVRSMSRGVSYGAIIEYEYQVAGERHRSKRYSLSGPHYVSFKRRAQRLLSRFPAGTAVTVSYDPAEPHNGVIALQAPQIAMLRVIFWVFFILIAWLVGGVLLFEPMFGSAPLIRL